MNAQELRIGNWVDVPECSMGIRKSDKREHAEVFDITEDGINYFQFWGEEKLYVIPWNEIKPIPITAEILEAAGFKLDGGVPIMEIAYVDMVPCVFQIHNGMGYVCRADTMAIAAPCQYLHQLQNLIFALTGKELEINL